MQARVVLFMSGALHLQLVERLWPSTQTFGGTPHLPAAMIWSGASQWQPLAVF